MLTGKSILISLKSKFVVFFILILLNIISHLLKYIISKSDLSDYYEEAYTLDGFTAYYNPYHLSIGYGVSEQINDFIMIPDTEYSEKDPYSNPFDRMNALITAMLGSEELVQVFVPLESAAAEIK